MAPLLSDLRAELTPSGLQTLGHCATGVDDGLAVDGALVLIGPDEPSFWPIFAQSREYHDGLPDPLDRWSKRVLGDIATHFDATALYPFGGPPFRPVMTWALRSRRFWTSPIGFLVHDTAGLFVSLRGVMLVNERLTSATLANPCATCLDKPCLAACPVDAFTSGYDVEACKSHLTTPSGRDCMTLGCRSRRACPIGQGNRLSDQATHYMKAFL